MFDYKPVFLFVKRKIDKEFPRKIITKENFELLIDSPSPRENPTNDVGCLIISFNTICYIRNHSKIPGKLPDAIMI
ncbi:hypothetical protein DRQ36_09835 [bacterium]|nr:MAG: hypothetical protein DRQ36_09835 [bacterium]